MTILALNSWIKPPSPTNMFLLVLNFHNLEMIFEKKKSGKNSENSRENVNNRRIAKISKKKN
jgi:hypothetical protein